MDATPVIIVVCNQPEYSQACLDSLYNTDPGIPIAPIVIDNGSGRRRTQAMLRDWRVRWESLPDDTKIHCPVMSSFERNRGFAAGVNHGVTLAKKYVKGFENIIILHNDTIPFAGWAREMTEAIAELDEDVAVIMPRTNYANEHSVCIQHVRERFEKVKPNNKSRILPEEIDEIMRRTYPEGQAGVLQEISDAPMRTSYCPEISSFCMLIRRDAMSQCPPFDEDFFPRGYEEKYWFLPLERSGFVAAIANRAYAHHFGNISVDGPGYDFRQIMDSQKELFDKKVSELNKKGPLGTIIPTGKADEKGEK